MFDQAAAIHRIHRPLQKKNMRKYGVQQPQHYIFFPSCWSEKFDIQGDLADAWQTATISHVGQVESEEANTALASSRSHRVFNLPSYLDLGVLGDDELKNENKRIKLRQEAWPDCQKFQFPARFIRNKQIMLNPQWLLNNEWMQYSISNDSVRCVYCVFLVSRRKCLNRKDHFFLQRVC